MAIQIFIDVNNTEKTTSIHLGWDIDWVKCLSYLQSKYPGALIYLYGSYEKGDSARIVCFHNIQSTFQNVRILMKENMIYKRPEKPREFTCSNCAQINIKYVSMGYIVKGNCDSELSVDVMKNVNHSDEVLLFSGDGDFAYMINILVREKAVSCKLITTMKPKIIAGKPIFRVALKYKTMNTRNFSLLEIDNFKMSWKV